MTEDHSKAGIDHQPGSQAETLVGWYSHFSGWGYDCSWSWICAAEYHW